jgi:hypothetical protein
VGYGMPDKQELLNALEKEIKRSQNKIKFMEKQLNVSQNSVNAPTINKTP